MKIVLGIAILLLALGVPGVNIYHHLELPSLNKYRIVESNTYNLPSLSSLGYMSHHYDITLEDQVVNSYWYEDVSKVLREAKNGDTVTFYLYGYGGREDTMYLLINQIHASKATVTMSVEAPVYSALAYLSVSGDKLEMKPYTWLMFHFSSVLNEDCNVADGQDRGVSNVEHCFAFYNTDVELGKRLLKNLGIFSDTEIQRLETGHDLYLLPEDAMTRYNNKGKNL